MDFKCEEGNGRTSWDTKVEYAVDLNARKEMDARPAYKNGVSNGFKRKEKDIWGPGRRK